MNSFGNTFTNLFEGIENIEIAHICCQGGTMDSRLIDEAFQMTDKSVAKSILGFRSGQIIRNTLNKPSTKKINVPRKPIFYFLREIIWTIGRWKSKSLRRYIETFNPDFLYLPIYRSHYMCEVDKYVIKITKKPYIVHISDDIYGYKPNISPIDKCLQDLIRKDIRQIFKNASYGEVFSPLMAEEYNNEFKIPFYLTGKSVDHNKLLNTIPCHKDSKDFIRFVYTGNYGGERGLQIISLAQSINSIFPKGFAVLDIYSATKADDEIESKLSKIDCVRLKGSIKHNKILTIQQQADYLIHIEGFTQKAIFDSRLSFSTKIIDYLVAGQPIIAIGPENVTSVQELKNYDMAYIATTPQEINIILSRIAKKQTDNELKVSNGRKYLLQHRDAKKIKNEMYQRIIQLIQK